MMEKFGIGYGDLHDIPYEKFLDFQRINRIEAKEEQKETEKQKRKADKKY